jgi:hypothetical protein
MTVISDRLKDFPGLPEVLILSASDSTSKKEVS